LHNPLDQFLIKKIVPLSLWGVDVSLTNASCFMILVTVSLIVFQWLSIREGLIIPTRLQVIYEASYDFIAGTLRDNVGTQARAFVPFVYSFFLFILFGNLLGMIPYGFTITSHIAVTFMLALVVFLVVLWVGFRRHGWHFFKLFFPEGAPLWTAPLLIPLEVLSFLIRPVTLALRLFLNMMAGHILLKVFSGFIVLLMGMKWMAPLAVMPLAFTIIFTGFEFFVACLQAYIFTVLSCIYLNDAVNLH
jgi:F-type H+-transporting ATPase subunit a